VPELPEVETMVRDLARELTGRTLRAPRLLKSDVLRGISPRRLLATLEGNRIEEISRRAKHAVFRLASGHRMVIQPGMTGNLLVCRRPLKPSERRYAILEARAGPGRILLYRDVRRLGTVRLLDPAAWQRYSEALGPEPLSPGFDAAALAERLGGTRQAIKKALMDQRRIAGVGNIYANEALFRAGIDPSQPADRLGPEDVVRLHRALQAVLHEALAANGTTFRDYRTGRGEVGGYQFALRVYGRGGQGCPACGTRLHTTYAVDGRATTFCWRCQSAR
jgi:formamidopyrimidine-DNA glycosylase